MIEALASAGCIAATLALAALNLVLGLRLSGAARALDRADVVELEAQRLWVAEQQVSDVQRLSEAAVSGGTLTVRAIHKGIAAIPFGVLEAIPATRDTTRIVRASHDLISDAVYGTIGAVNRGIGAGLRAGLKASAKKPEPLDTPKEPPARKEK